jgi:hypothetical protein
MNRDNLIRFPPLAIVVCHESREISHLAIHCNPLQVSTLLVTYSKSNLPRLLVEVNSKPKKEGPEETLIWMLLTGAASIVRFANK